MAVNLIPFMKAESRGLLLTLFALALFILYLAWSNPFAAFYEVEAFDFAAYLTAIVVDQLGLVLYALSWHMILKAMDVGISSWGTIQLTYTSLVVSWLAPLPMIGETVRAYLVRDRSGSNMGKALSSVIVHRAYYNIVFGIVIGLAGAYALNENGLSINTALTVILIIFAIASSIIFALALNTNFLRKVYTRSPEWARKKVFDRVSNPEASESGFKPVIDDVGEAVYSLKKRAVLSFLSILMLAFHWIAGAIAAYLSARAIGVHLGIPTTILSYGAVEFLQQSNFFIPSGLGLLDAGLAGALVLAGIPLSQAAAISLLTRICTYWLELVVCVPVALRFGYREFVSKYGKG